MEPNNFKTKKRVLIGLFLVAAGILLFAFKMGAPLPAWIFTWPVALIAIGLLVCLKHNFNNPGGLILILIGSMNLIDHMYPGYRFHTFIAPVIIIVIGLIFIFRSGKYAKFRPNMHDDEVNNIYPSLSDRNNDNRNDDADYINSVSVFGGVKKNILSKNFRGGEITCFMGGAEFNLSQADIKSQVVLEVTQVFGGTKLIVPANWYIKTEAVTVFGGIEDKRPIQSGNINYEKTLILIGTTVFGGIDIRSY